MKPGPRLIATMLYRLSYGVCWQNLNYNLCMFFKYGAYSDALFSSGGPLIKMLLLTAFFLLSMSTVHSIFSIVIFNICMSLFESTT